MLTPDNWLRLHAALANKKTFSDLILHAISFVCENDQKEIVGCSFLVLSGNPTEIYGDHQSYIRFVTVSQHHKGHHLGQRLTERCIEEAKKNNEKAIALHTAEFMDAARHIYEKPGFKIVRELSPGLGKRYWLYELVL